MSSAARASSRRASVNATSVGIHAPTTRRRHGKRATDGRPYISSYYRVRTLPASVMPGHRTSARPPPQERADEKIHKRQNDRRADGTEKEHAGGEILDRPQDDQKLAARQRILGHEIHAAEQLTVWAERAGVPIIKHGEGAAPAAVVFDAAASFKARNRDMLLCDTAGRLHNKKNLMNELEKMRRVLDRELPGVPVEALMVLDATTGQNAIAQARAFGESAGLTGIILTKLDGTAKGGVAVAVKEELKIPVRFVGVGEGIDDMQAFDPDDYARALLSEE